MSHAPAHPTASLPETGSTHDGRSPARSGALALAVGAALVSLGAVVGGFVLVALALVGVGDVPLSWGAGACVGGWALAAALHEGRGRARE